MIPLMIMANAGAAIATAPESFRRNLRDITVTMWAPAALLP
jgi:hypothetical protein